MAGEEIDNMVRLMRKQNRAAMVVPTAWATCKEVDWDNYTMTATGTTDDLDYYEVLLGLGSYKLKPAVGAKCLLGTVADKPEAKYLIWADEVESIHIVNNSQITLDLIDGELHLNGSNLGGLIVIANLVNKLNALEQAVNNLATAYDAHGHGGNGAAPPPPSGVSVTETQVEDIENETVKHGN